MVKQQYCIDEQCPVFRRVFARDEVACHVCNTLYNVSEAQGVDESGRARTQSQNVQGGGSIPYQRNNQVHDGNHGQGSVYSSQAQDQNEEDFLIRIPNPSTALQTHADSRSDWNGFAYSHGAGDGTRGGYTQQQSSTPRPPAPFGPAVGGARGSNERPSVPVGPTADRNRALQPGHGDNSGGQNGPRRFHNNTQYFNQRGYGGGPPNHQVGPNQANNRGGYGGAPPANRGGYGGGGANQPSGPANVQYQNHPPRGNGFPNRFPGRNRFRGPRGGGPNHANAQHTDPAAGPPSGGNTPKGGVFGKHGRDDEHNADGSQESKKQMKIEKSDGIATKTPTKRPSMSDDGLQWCYYCHNKAHCYTQCVKKWTPKYWNLGEDTATNVPLANPPSDLCGFVAQIIAMSQEMIAFHKFVERRDAAQLAALRYVEAQVAATEDNHVEREKFGMLRKLFAIGNTHVRHLGLGMSIAGRGAWNRVKDIYLKDELKRYGPGLGLHTSWDNPDRSQQVGVYAQLRVARHADGKAPLSVNPDDVTDMRDTILKEVKEYRERMSAFLDESLSFAVIQDLLAGTSMSDWPWIRLQPCVDERLTFVPKFEYRMEEACFKKSQFQLPENLKFKDLTLADSGKGRPSDESGDKDMTGCGKQRDQDEEEDEGMPDLGSAEFAQMGEGA